MKVSESLLLGLMEIYSVQTELNKNKAQLTKLASGDHLLQIQDEILQASQLVIDQRGVVEEIDREISRVAADLELVEKRIAKDQSLINASTSTKDIQGIQHELDTLANRKDELETSELELMERIDSEKSALEQLIERKRVLESELAKAEASTSAEIDQLKARILENENALGKLRAQSSAELLAIYDQRAARGVPVGKLMKSTCGACNMSLTSTAMTELHKVPSDELARCPECSAILVRS